MKRKFNALILEDDSMVVEQLVGFLHQTDLFEQPYVCQSTMQAIMALQHQPTDLLLLDMELPDMPSLELLRLFPNHSPVIAISAHPKYAVDCYDYDINDFISKPLSYSRFMRGLRRTVLKTPIVVDAPATSSVPMVPQHLPVTSKPKASSSNPTYLYLKTGRKMERFVHDDILYLEAYGIYSKLITTKGTIVINELLSHLQEQLNMYQFMRVHKSYMVNLNQVTQFTTNTIWLSTYKIPIGGTYKVKVQAQLETIVNVQ